jgi:hypothetical protein
LRDFVISNLEGILEQTDLLNYLFEEAFKEQQTRTTKPRVEDYWETPWGQNLRNPEVRCITSAAGKQFRRAFRLPALFFTDWFVPKCIAVNVFDSKIKKNGDFMGHIPIEFKILACLRILARGNCCDDMRELSIIGESTCNYLFVIFVINFATRLKSEFIRMPEGEELHLIHNVYRKLGFPGCIGSIDCTHVRWRNCPVRFTNYCSGKSGFPTLSFQVVVTHDRRVIHVNEGQFGALNDINICSTDPIIRDDVTGLLTSDGLSRNLYKDFEYTLYDEDGQPVRMKGAYFLSDGGYEPICIFVNPNAYDTTRASVIWSEFLESIRKDIECLFGGVKQRFQFLLIGCRFSSQEVISCAFVTACILHNMLLLLDGYDIAAWEHDVDWSDVEMDPRLWTPEEVVVAAEGVDVVVQGMEVADDEIVGAVGVSGVPVGSENLEDDVEVVPFEGQPDIPVDGGLVQGGAAGRVVSPVRAVQGAAKQFPLTQLGQFKRELITHFWTCFRLGRIQWPKKMKGRRGIGNVATISSPDAIYRALAYVHDSLIIQPSSLRREGRTPGNYVVDIGDGLFTTMTILSNEPISDFIGDLVSNEERLRRENAGSGGNMKEIELDLFLDSSRFLQKCKASKANSPFKCIVASTRRPAVANAKLLINTRNKRVSLVAVKAIGPGDEILFEYDEGFIFPQLPANS